MNYLRLLIGTVVAIVVLMIGGFAFLSILGRRILAAREAAGLPPPVPQPLAGIPELVLTAFFLVWLYAAVRPRFGPGLMTAVKAGFAGWFGLVFLGTLHIINDNFGFPPELLLTIAIAVLPVFVLATVAGAWVYKEPLE
jgi:hypothetical protein